MGLEYCIYCGYPLKGNVVCPGCEKEVKQMIPLAQVKYNHVPENVISQLEKSKVSLFQMASKKKIVEGMKKGNVGYIKVKVVNSYAGKRSENEEDIQFYSLDDEWGNPLEFDISLKKGGQIQRDLQREYSAHLKDTDGILIRFDQSTYYVFSAKFEETLGQYMASGWGDIWDAGHHTQRRKVHEPRKDLEEKDEVFHADPNAQWRWGDDYEYLGTDPIEGAVRKVALNGLGMAAKKISDMLPEEDEV